MRILLGSVRRYLSFSSRSFSARSGDEVRLEQLKGDHEGIAYLTMHRPEAKNALSRNFVGQLEKCLQDLRTKKEVRVLIMRSTVPGVFCAGADLKERRKMNESDVEGFVERLRNAASAIEDLPMPTIAALDGAALGGGLEMALACDIRVASKTAKLGLVETKLAVIPGAGGTQRLPRIVGPVIAKELILTARVLNGAQAQEIGLVNHVADDGQTVENLALKIASEILPNGPVALRMAKLAINKGMQVSLSDGLAFEKSYYAQIINTKDRIEGLSAFAEKRKPAYKGE
ncbi:methylglutaconyl-CoA hydratase, mitochondrial [Galendromus occidentalis]|uniref:Methylglutaconyl-CoA hydratase, mitochondrial n=1 Tax=Galendromus occidentalis TaxID=34638 RepID=A0AAJ6W0G1_9ACAR|nr:methylglutaconyl-CoA hydratase, mitochondrial [Galendromus occidentalis]